MPELLTLEEITDRLQKRNFILNSEYKGTHKPHLLKCIICGKDTICANLKNIEKRVCEYCNTKEIKYQLMRDKTKEKHNKILAINNLTISSEYINTHNKFTIKCLICNHEFTIATLTNTDKLFCRYCNQLTCLKCGKKFIAEENKAVRGKTIRKLCFECSPKTIDSKSRAQYIRILNEEKKKILIKRYGSACTRCGYNECLASLDFHHINCNNKDYSICSFLSIKNDITSFFPELDKCILLCANCHRKVHYDLNREKEINI